MNGERFGSTCNDCSFESRFDPKAELIKVIAGAPPMVRAAIVDLIYSIRSSLEAVGRSIGLDDPKGAIGGWEELLATLTALRLSLDRLQTSRIDRLRLAHPNLIGLEHRFDLLKRAYEQQTLMVEIIYSLIDAGGEFQTPVEVLEQSADIMLAELEADLFVCRLRDEEGGWQIVATNSALSDKTPLFVLHLEEEYTTHPVMRAVAHESATYVLSNNLRGPEKGGESHDCVAFQEGYRSRLAFILRDGEGKAFGLIMLYSKSDAFFDRYESKFLGDCSRIVSLTVGARLEAGRDALAKAAGGMAHVGNNALALLRGCLEITTEELALFSEEAQVILETEIPLGPATETKFKQATDLARAAKQVLSGLDAKSLNDNIGCALDGADRMRGAIANLLSAVTNPKLMPYVRGEEVLDLDPRNAT